MNDNPLKWQEKKQQCLLSCGLLRYIEKDDKDELVGDNIRIDFNHWYTYLVDDQLLEKIPSSQTISLRISDVDILTVDLCDKIAGLIGHKLTEIIFENGSKKKWTKEIKALLRKSSNLTSLKFRNILWLTDDIVEQITVRYNKLLQVLEFNSCTNISNFCFHHIGKRCHNLKSFTLINCPNVTDSALIELSKDIHCSYINLGHSLQLSDKGVIAMISKSKNLRVLHLINCPKLTDMTINTLYEKSVSWGTKRNEAAQSVEVLELRDNNNFTSQLLLWLSTSTINISSIDLRDCIGLEPSRSIADLSNLRCLKDLKLGPSNYRVNPQLLKAGIEYHAERLTSLYLEGLIGFDDDSIADLFELTYSLSSISIVNMPFGTATTEAICSNIPNVSKIYLVGSNDFKDIDLRCFASVCIHMRDITINNCNALTEAGFVRFVGLRLLTRLNLNYCSQNINGSVMKFLTHAQLETISLDGLELFVVTGFSTLPVITRCKLKSISLRETSNITPADVRYLVENFVGCKDLDLTGCYKLNIEQLISLQHYNPFLRYKYLPEESRFGLITTRDTSNYHTFFTFRCFIYRHYAARIFQQGWKKYLQMKKDLKELLKKFKNSEWLNMKVALIVKLQGLIRKHRVKKRFRVRLLAGRKLVHFCKSRIIFWEYLRRSRAIRHHKRKLKKKSFYSIAQFPLLSNRFLERVTPIVEERIHKLRLSHWFHKIRNMKEEIKQINFDELAMSLWANNFLRKVIKCWKKVIFETSSRKQLLVRAFMSVVSLKYWNSARQLRIISMATHFRNQRLTILAWMVLAKDRLERIRIDNMEPFAIEHAQKTFFNRMVTLTYKSWYHVVKERIWKRQRKNYGQQQHLRRLCNNGYNAIGKNWARTTFLKSAMKKAIPVRDRYLKMLCMRDRFIPLVYRIVWYKANIEKSYEFKKENLVKKGFRDMIRGVIRCRKMRKMNLIADLSANTRRLKMTYKAWDDFRIYCRKMDEYYFQRYQKKLCKKAITGLKANAAKKREATRVMQEELERKAGGAAAIAKVMGFIQKFQAKCRARLVRRKYEEIRVQKLFAIQIIQNFVRKRLARNLLKSIRKKIHIVEKVREDTEIDLMREAEAEMRFYLYQLNAVVTIQRIFRGIQGRKYALECAISYFRYKGYEFVKLNHHLRLHHEAFLRAAQLREQQKSRAAVEIQRIARGRAARIRFKEMKLHALTVKKALIVQTLYRQRLAYLKLQALRRDKLNEIRFRAARRQRGKILRFLGLKKRGLQGLVAPFLGDTGLDPITFNHRVGELVAESIEDAKDFYRILQREYNLLKVHGFNQLNRMLDRRRILASNGWKMHLREAVKLVEYGHPFEGRTGTIVRIDETLLGAPLFEVKLDRFTQDTYVRMTTDPMKIYETAQPLAKIQTEPTLPPFDYSPIFGLNSENPFYCKKNVYAAWTIQRGYRMHRAKKVVARKRYEHWKQNVARNWSMLSHFSDVNGITYHGSRLATVFGLKSVKPVKFAEIRHRFLPQRFTATVRKPSEQYVVDKECEARTKDRLKYLQKSAIIRGKQFFSKGAERMTFDKKMRMLLNMQFGLRNKSDNAKVSDIRSGARGLQVLAKKTNLVEGMDRYCFNQFKGSPHVRYYKTSIFQGEWSGLPLLTPLKPHGEGLVVFLDGWGYCKEDKVLYVTIISCKQLSVMDLSGTSDPYCDIYCNNVNLQSTVKWGTLNPEFHESFEIDVTNPEEKLNIVVKDKDYFGSDDFLGQVSLPLKNFLDGVQYQETYTLRPENLNIPEEECGDHGEIELRIRWAERVDEEENIRSQVKVVMLIRLQAWVRRTIAARIVAEKRRERKENLKKVHIAALKITNMCRVRIARKIYRRILRQIKSAIKIQKRVRIWIARRVFRHRKLMWKMAIKVQSKMRVFLSKLYVKRLKEKIVADLNATVTLIQKNARRRIARVKTKKMRRIRAKERKEMMDLLTKVEAGEALDENSKYTLETLIECKKEMEVEKLHSSYWIHTYGVDPEYGLKRNRRITLRMFKKMLTLKYVRFLTKKLGVVYLDSYPPRRSDEEMLLAQQAALNGGGPASRLDELINKDDFLGAFLPTFRPTALHRKEAIEQHNKYNHVAILHIPTSIELRRSVDYTISTVQCLYRQKVAKKEKENILRVHRAIAKFQKIFRKRYEKLHKAAVLITALFHGVHAKTRAGLFSKERRAAVTIQCAYRCYLARTADFDLRCVNKLSVLKSFPESDPKHPPDKCLEHRADTFWMAMSKEKAEIRVEFAKYESIVSVWIMTSTFSASPNFVSIAAIIDKKEGYTELEDRYELPLLKERRWHRFIIPITTTKYFKITFQDNYGDDEFISVRQIRFLRSKEMSAKIIHQPKQYILTAGPTVGDTAEIVLRCEAVGWPTPTFQWFRNKQLIEGATNKEIRLELHCPLFGQRTYRCIKCKMVARHAPYNAYHVKCGNCATLFAYKEPDEFDRQIAAIKDREEDYKKQKVTLQATKIQLESFQSVKYEPIIAELKEQISNIEVKLQVLREERYTSKQKSSQVNHFSDEGIYTCLVQNVRGGSLKIKKYSIPSVVVVEKPSPFIMDVSPLYYPRAQTFRKKWNIYASMHGTFNRGKVEGIITVRYHDGSIYEGPYVDEQAIDKMGKTKEKYRQPNHYGIYRLADGRVFEGNNVDNHFDPYNLQTFYKVTMPNSEVYQGSFCDEQYHGVGMYTFVDGSIYEGQWYRGSRFGHGHYRSSEGWTYEGFFDTNRRHRRGVIDWPNGACYMGEWYYDKIAGNGIFITPLRDVYKGEMKDGKFHGFGELYYADGSKYVGEFADGYRHGRGVFLEREGTESYGHFKNDLRFGDHVVKLNIPLEEVGQDNYEIRIGSYEEGKLIKWKSKFSNPIATKQFIELFRQNRDMFDSVFSMILAKNLPNLPEGIDANNKKVKNIVYRIRLEAGMLVGQQALDHAQAQLNALLGPLKQRQEDVERIKKEIETISGHIITLEKEANDLHYKFTNLIGKYEKDTARIEQFWQDDPKQVRWAFRNACKALDTITTNDYFYFRNHRHLPPFTKKIFDAVCHLLGLEIQWKIQQALVADSAFNGRNGDEEALRHEYKCKLSHMMKDFNVFDYVNIKKLIDLQKILADARFRYDSYYIESTGKAGPVLVVWIKACYHYIITAQQMMDVLQVAEGVKVEAFRFKAMGMKKREEMQELGAKQLALRKSLNDAQFAEVDLQHAVVKANDLLEFIAGRYDLNSGESKMDYYKLLEKKMEQQRDKFQVEVCLRGLVDGVVAQCEKEKRIKILQAFAQGKLQDEEQQKRLQYDEGQQAAATIVGWIREEVRAQQKNILDGGRTLGYNFEPESTDVNKDYTMQLVSLIVDIVIGKLNDGYNDLAAAKSWLSRKGRRFNSRFLYIMSWKVWQDEALDLRDRLAIEAWEGIFGDEDTCARKAIEARVNSRMSSLARAQGKAWAIAHPEAIRQSEYALAQEYQDQFESYEEVAPSVLTIEMDSSDAIPPITRAQALCWSKLHPDEMTAARDNLFIQYAQAFEDQFEAETANTCFRLLNGLGREDEQAWIEYAQHWKDFHSEQYDAASLLVRDEMAKEFVEAFPISTNMEAARVTDNHALARHVRDPELKGQLLTATTNKFLFHAYSWGTLNQGLFRKAKEILLKEQLETLNKQWNELITATSNLQKGSALLANIPIGSPKMSKKEDNDQANSKDKDRFVGFRNRLANKYAWIYGFLRYRHEVLVKELEQMALVDPLEKVMHRVRPSEFDKVHHEKEQGFLGKRKKLETDIEALVKKLSDWHTYFGWSNTVEEENVEYE